MTEIEAFLEIPVRDDAAESTSFERGFQTLSVLKSIGLDVNDRHVVDLGTGFGSLAIAAAKSGAAEVVAIDVHPLRLAAVQERATLAGAELTTQQANLLLPFGAPANADIAFLIGVVEYAGLWNATSTPEALQAQVLRTALSALKPGGKLVVGTKNRLWPGFILHDVHTGKPLVNILPRALADRLSMRLSNTRYRHHIHTPAGWRSIVLAAGFSDVDLYVPFFSYQYPLFVTERPRFRDIRTVRRRAMQDGRQSAELGRIPTIKATLMAVAGLLHLPISHSTVLVATK